MGTEREQRVEPVRPVPAGETWRQRLVAASLAGLVKVWFATLRVEVRDESGLGAAPPAGGSIWVFWHNRIFCVPCLYRRVTRGLTAGAVLTSASRDGAQLAAVMARFGFRAVRGSSSKRAAQALVVSWRQYAATWQRPHLTNPVPRREFPRAPLPRHHQVRKAALRQRDDFPHAQGRARAECCVQPPRRRPRLPHPRRPTPLGRRLPKGVGRPAWC